LGAHPMIMTTWDTTRVAVPHQLEFWHEVVCKTFVPLRSIPADTTPGFVARVETWPLAAVSPARIMSPAQRTEHGSREVARSSEPFHFVNLQLSGRCLVEQDGRREVAGPGDCVVLDTTLPYTLDFDSSWSMLSFRLPHAQLAALCAPWATRGGLLSGGTGRARIIAGLIRSLWALEEDVPTLIGLEDAFAATVASCLRRSAPSNSGDTDDADLRARALGHALVRLADPTLSVSAVARALGVSPRRLHSAFAGAPMPFAGTVRRMRLERCLQLLSNPAITTQITQIGAMHGFPEPSSFSRAFRREFGTSPRQARDQAVASAQLNVAVGS
jgi:AraC family transcriptional activator of tynA and feaB